MIDNDDCNCNDDLLRGFGGKMNHAQIATMAKRGENILRLLSWNIDGLDEKNTKERTEEVCRIILLKRPHLVFLQEIVGSTQAEARSRLFAVCQSSASSALLSCDTNQPQVWRNSRERKAQCVRISWHINGKTSAVNEYYFPRSVFTGDHNPLGEYERLFC